MTLKRKGNSAINADIISPEIEVASFSGLSHSTIDEIVLNHNYGRDMLMLYKRVRDNMHIKNIMEFLEEADKLFKVYDYETYEARRK